MSDYSSIMDHPHYQSKKRPHMSMTARAAQFSPFAALTGYGEAVEEAGRLTDEKIILDDNAIAEIDRKLQMIENDNAFVTITYFIADVLKEGGSYIIASGEVRKIDRIEGRVIMKDGTVIPIDDILDIGFINDQ